MNRSSKIIFAIGFLLLLGRGTFAQSFSASVQNTTVGTGETFQISFEFQGKDINGVRNFQAPDFRGLQVLSGPNQSTSMQIINGAVSASMGFVYYLRADNPGSITIGEASLSYKGKTYKTRPVTIKVVRSSQPNSKGGNSGSGGEDNAAAKNISENVFIRATADKNRVYKGEQVTVTYKLYTRLDIASPQISKLPVYQGFWAEEIESPSVINFSTEVLNGKAYHVAVLKKAALFPTQSGELSVTPFELVIPVAVPKQRRRGDIFDEFFNDPFFNRPQTVEYKAKSNTLKIAVVPLPQTGVPSSFNGAVGDFSFSASMDKSQTKTNDPVTLKLNISGVGNISLLQLPAVSLPAGLEKYDPKVSQQINKSSRLSGTKTAEYLIIPRYEGQKTIAPVEFSYFSPTKKKYITVTSEAFTLKISGSGTGYTAGRKQESIRQLGDDIRYIKTRFDEPSLQGDTLYSKAWFWMMVILPFAAFLGLVYWKGKNDELESDVQMLRFRRAEKMARKYLNEARTALQMHRQDEFYSGVSQALFGYMENKLHIPKSEFTIDLTVEELQRKNAPEQVVAEVKDALMQCEFARFAPARGTDEQMNQMYEKAVSIIVELEKHVFSNSNRS